VCGNQKLTCPNHELGYQSPFPITTITGDDVEEDDDDDGAATQRGKPNREKKWLI